MRWITSFNLDPTQSINHVHCFYFIFIWIPHTKGNKRYTYGFASHPRKGIKHKRIHTNNNVFYAIAIDSSNSHFDAHIIKEVEKPRKYSHDSKIIINNNTNNSFVAALWLRMITQFISPRERTFGATSLPLQSTEHMDCRAADSSPRTLRNCVLKWRTFITDSQTGGIIVGRTWRPNRPKPLGKTS